MEQWSNGAMEQWSNGATTKMTKQSQFLITTIKSSNLHCCDKVRKGLARFSCRVAGRST